MLGKEPHAIDQDGFRIAPADPVQGPALQRLILSVLQEYGLAGDPEGIDADVLDIERHYRQLGGEFYAVSRQGELVGTMGIAPVSAEACELRKMYLLPAARGRGLGKQLLQLAEREAHRRGFRVMQLETASVLHEAIALYERHGYQAYCGTAHACRCDRMYQKRLAD